MEAPIEDRIILLSSTLMQFCGSFGFCTQPLIGSRMLPPLTSNVVGPS